MRQTLQRARCHAPLPFGLWTPSATIGDADGKGLHEIAGTRAHAWPKRQVACLWCVGGG